MLDRVILLTGATGLVGGDVMRRYAARGVRVYTLVRAGSDAEAAQRLAARLPDAAQRPIALAGDLTQPRLGLSETAWATLADEVTDILHAATDIHFGRPLAEAWAVNVTGTERVLDLARAARRLRQYGHVSTVHIAGRRVGDIRETELEHDAGWVNTYEQTKYEAERLLSASMAELPITVYRMSSVVGDSRTGEVRQFNFLHQLMRLVWGGLVPALPADPDGPVDLIASDWVADALVALFERRFVPGETLHLCAGPDRAYSLAEILDVTLAEFDRWLPPGRRRPTAPALVSLEEFSRLVKAVEAEGRQRQAQALGAIATFTPHLALPKAFDNRLARAALAPLGVAWPSIRDYYPRVVEYCVKTGWGRVASPAAAQETSHAAGSATSH